MRDAKGLYGNSLIQRQRKLEEIPSVSIEFQLSYWTKSLISDYKNIAEKLINKRKHIVMLYAEIRRYYAKFNNYWKKLLEYIQKKRNVHINELVICLNDIASFCGMEL